MGDSPGLLVPQLGQTRVIASDAVGGPVGLTMSYQEEFHVAPTVYVADSLAIPNTMESCPGNPSSIISLRMRFEPTGRSRYAAERSPIGTWTPGRRRSTETGRDASAPRSSRSWSRR